MGSSLQASFLGGGGGGELSYLVSIGDHVVSA